jgi:hypothetical protein
MGDVNRDGNLDLVCGNFGGSNTLYFGEEGRQFLDAEWVSDSSLATQSVALGDVNGDGYLDLVCANYNEVNTLYLNNGRSFDSVAIWSSDDARKTLGVALADVDGKGGLDLIFANSGQPNTIHFNKNKTDTLFARSPDWRSEPTNNSVGVCVGDVDGDTYLDVLFANDAQVNTLYMSDAGQFPLVPDWRTSESETNRTFKAIFGDIDGNGHLDLVCGNVNAVNTVYFNDGALLDTLPGWRSTAAIVTTSIDIGDGDRDGDLDLVCGNYGEGNTLYLNVAGVLDVMPAWSSTQQNNTFDVALADMGNDGDLDLVCGNEAQVNTLYEMEGFLLADSPTWTSDPTNSTFGVELADIDADGDLDLICGNGGFLPQPNTVYVNDKGILAQIPWETGVSSGTYGIAVGDVDDDGDLDLVCGNANARNTLYVNDGGFFKSTPAWRSGPEKTTIVVALGDVNGDFLPDLVCGNGGVQGDINTVYYNVGPDSGYFSTEPDWESDPDNITVGVALADFNGDGNLDLVCGNNGQPNTIYPGRGRELATNPIWFSARANNTFEVAVGDVDGDGDADIVCGNGGFIDQANTLYLNESIAGDYTVQIKTTPYWSSDPVNSSTFGVELSDVDGDGRLDLVTGNESQQNSLYLNTGGPEVFGLIPDWTSGPTNSTFGVAVGDVDGDGDFDIVCGNNDQPNTMYPASFAPVFKANPETPRNHLANNGGFLRSVIAERPNSNTVHLTFDAVDVESDAVYLRPEYQFEGDPNWFVAEGAIEPLPTSPAGVSGSWDWDVRRVPPDDREVVLRLRAISTPSRVSRIQHVSKYMKAIGSIEPIIPRLVTSADSLFFPTVTVGDTATAQMLVSNRGKANLMITRIVLPSPTEMSVSLQTPAILEPDSSDSVVVSLLPRSGTAVSGDLTFESDDPVDPIQAVGLKTDIRKLEIRRTRLLSPAPEVPLGEAVTVIVDPEPLVRVERGFLYHRARGDTAFIDSIELTPSGVMDGLVLDFIAVIPGSAVTERGFEYYVRVENDSIFATDPLGAPQDYFPQDVRAPDLIATNAIPNHGDSEFLQNRDINVQVILPVGASLDLTKPQRLYYRRGGETDYKDIDVHVQAGRPRPFAVVPRSAVGARGVEYWVEVQSLTSVLRDPPNAPVASPNWIAISVPNLVEPTSHPGAIFSDIEDGSAQYRMVTVPLDFRAPFTMEDLLSEQDAFGVYRRSPPSEPWEVQWRCFRYVSADSPTIELPPEAPDPESEFTVIPGRAFWLISRHENRIETAPIRGFSTPTIDDFEIVLQPGHNQIGSPFMFPVAWDSMMVDTQRVQDAENALVVESPWRYRNGDYDPIDDQNPHGTRVLEPFEGYFVKNKTDPPKPVTLKIRPVEADSAQPLHANDTSDPGDTPPSERWRLRIEASSGGARDFSNIAGVDPDADREGDRLDRSEPPPAPGKSLSVYFPHRSWRKHPGVYAYDMRGDYEDLGAVLAGSSVADGNLWGHAWFFDITKSFADEPAGDEVTISIGSIEDVPSVAKILLIDRELARTIDIREQNRYTFFERVKDFVTEDTEARFALVVGSETFAESQTDELVRLPVQTVLHQNHPNPFNPTTIIRYEIAHATHVTITVYDATGALVKELYRGHRKPGIYDTAWHGKNDQGQQVASGVYFYRMQAGSFLQTRKLVLLK